MLFLLVLAAPARADEEVLRFVQTVHDMGAISDDQTQMHAFAFINTSPRMVKLAMTYCHFCTPPLLDNDTIKPGESGTIVLEINPAGRKGRIVATATIMEEGKPTSAVNVELRADICPRIWLEPSSMFPRIVRGEGATASFSAMGRKSDFKVLRIESDPPIAGLKLGEPETVPDCGSTVRTQLVTVAFPKDVPLGPWSTRLKVITNDDDSAAKFVSVEGTVVGRVSFDPPVLGLRLPPGEAFAISFDVVAADAGNAQGAVLLDSLDITARDEAEELVLDAVPTADPSRVQVTLCGRAPGRSRQSVVIQIEVVARTLGSSGAETIVVPVGLVVPPRRN